MTLITDANNQFYAGMTISEARRQGLDKSFWRRDFYNLDKDSDGVLSADEIIKERNRTSKIDKFMAAGFAVWGLYDLFTTKSKIWLAIALAFDTYIAGTCLNRAVKIDKKTMEYEANIRDSNLNRYA